MNESFILKVISIIYIILYPPCKVHLPYLTSKDHNSLIPDTTIYHYFDPFITLLVEYFLKFTLEIRTSKIRCSMFAG